MLKYIKYLLLTFVFYSFFALSVSADMSWEEIESKATKFKELQFEEKLTVLDEANKANEFIESFQEIPMEKTKVALDFLFEYGQILHANHKLDDSINVFKKNIKLVKERYPGKEYLLGIPYLWISSGHYMKSISSQKKEDYKIHVKSANKTQKFMEVFHLNNKKKFGYACRNVDGIFYYQLAFSYNRLSNIDKANEFSQKSIKALEQPIEKECITTDPNKENANNNYHLGEAYRVYASVLNVYNEREEAGKFLLKALDIYERIIDRPNPRAYLDIALYYGQINDVLNWEKYLLKAYSQTELDKKLIEDAKIDLKIQILYRLGDLYQSTRQFEKQEQTSKKIANLEGKKQYIGKTDKIFMDLQQEVNVCNSLEGRSVTNLKHQKDCKKSLNKIVKQTELIEKKYGRDYKIWLPYKWYKVIGGFYNRLNQPKQGKIYLTKALEDLKNYKSKNNWYHTDIDKIQLYGELSAVEGNLLNYEKGVESFNKTFSLIENTKELNQSRKNELLIIYYHYLSRFYYNFKQIDKALEFADKATELIKYERNINFSESWRKIELLKGYNAVITNYITLIHLTFTDWHKEKMRDLSTRDTAISQENYDKLFKLIFKSFHLFQLVETSRTALNLKRIDLQSKNKKIADLLRSRDKAFIQIEPKRDRLLQITQSLNFLDKEEIQSIQNEINNNEKKIEEINEKIKILDPNYKKFLTKNTFDSIEVVNKLHIDEAIIGFVVLEPFILYYVIRWDTAYFKTWMIKLKEKELNTLVRNIRAFKINEENNINTFDHESAHQLYKKLFSGSIKDDLKDIKKLIVIPDGALVSIPFSLLLTEEINDEDKKNNDYRKYPWLFKNLAISYQPSIDAFMQTRTKDLLNRKIKKKFVGFGDPILISQNSKLKGILTRASDKLKEKKDVLERYPRLPNTAEELKKISEVLKSEKTDIFLANNATEKKVKNLELSNTDIIAFSTHAETSNYIQNIYEPFLVLTPPKNISNNNDGLFTASEIAQMNLNASLVILSACNTAIDKDTNSYGISGLTRAFLYAGSQSIFASHWPVETFATELLVINLIKRYSQDTSIHKAEAHRLAIIDLINHENGKYSHPYFWAPFAIYGDGGPGYINYLNFGKSFLGVEFGSNKHIKGLFIKDVVKNSPAEINGIKKGDIISKFNGKNVINSPEEINLNIFRFTRRLQLTPEDKKVNIVLIRDEQEINLNILLGQRENFEELE